MESNDSRVRPELEDPKDTEIARLQRELRNTRSVLRDLRDWVGEAIWEASPELKSRLQAALGDEEAPHA